jgi:oligo-1,6-glucosidase/alpha-glucosidase
MPNNLPWYHSTSIYQIYPRSFYDSNADGIGDLRGILQKLDYIHGLGFETIWCSPFFASPQQDFGYDVSDYANTAPEYGQMEDALELIEAVHQRGMRIVFDMVMNHTSSQHPWFLESRASRDNPKADWYIWRERPNNWQSMTGGSGWHYAAERGQYYWASFLPFQPDLNYRNPQVKQAMLDVVHFWLDKGVDGFRLDIFNVIYKDAAFRDNPFAWSLAPSETDPSGFFQRPQYTLNQADSFAFARELRRVCDEFGEKLLLGEVSGGRGTIRQYLGGECNDGLTLVFDFEMLGFEFTADYFRGLIASQEQHFPAPFMPVYVFSNHDRRRSMERLGGDVRKAKLLHMLQLTVRGVPCLYYGEEIGMRNLRLPFHHALDPMAHKFKFLPRFVFDLLDLTINRDEVRTPMQWDASRHAGFSSAESTWLPVHGNYLTINVAYQDAEYGSLLNSIRALMKMRNEWTALRAGELTLLDGLPPDVLGCQRAFNGQALSIFLNFGKKEEAFAFPAGEAIFCLTKKDQFKDGKARLGCLGGLVVTQPLGS